MKILNIRKGTALILALSTILPFACCSNNSETAMNEETFEEIQLERHFDYKDDSRIDYELSRLDITNNTLYPRDVFKVVSFVDTNGFLRVIPVRFYANPVGEGEETINSYTAFYLGDDTELFVTSDFKNISAINGIFGDSIESCDGIDSLGDIAISHGASPEYVARILGDKETLTVSDALEMYFALVSNGLMVPYTMVENNVVTIK